MSIRFRALRLLLLSLIPCAGFFYLLGLHYSFDGILESTFDFKSKSPIISEITPNGRLGDIIYKKEHAFQPIELEPVYFSVKMPIYFNELLIRLSFDKDLPSIIYLGPQTGPGFRYGLMPVYNQFLEEIYIDKEWHTIKDNNLSFFQRKTGEKFFSTLEEFLDDLPESNQIGIFNYNLIHEFKIADYKKNLRMNHHNIVLRGPHNILTYIQDEDLFFEFEFIDLNRHKGPDPIQINLLHDGKIVKNIFLEDDGFDLETDPASKKRKLILHQQELANGVYKIQMVMNEDIFITQIKTPQTKFVFENKVYLADNLEYAKGIPDLKFKSTDLKTNGNQLSFRTTHSSGLQEIKIDDDLFLLEKTHELKHYKKVRLSSVYSIHSSQNDLIIQSDGVFAFTEKSFFDPRIQKIDESIDTIPENIDYIIAGYQSMDNNNEGFVHREFELDLNKYFRDKSKTNFVEELKFMIAAPGLDKQDKKIMLESIEVQLITNPVKGLDILRRIKNKR